MNISLADHRAGVLVILSLDVACPAVTMAAEDTADSTAASLQEVAVTAHYLEPLKNPQQMDSYICAPALAGHASITGALLLASDPTNGS